MVRKGTTHRGEKADLYRLVFDTRALKYVIFLMMIFFLLHPVMPAFASEFVLSEPEPEAAPPAEASAEAVQTSATEEIATEPSASVATVEAVKDNEAVEPSVGIDQSVPTNEIESTEITLADESGGAAEVTVTESEPVTEVVVEGADVTPAVDDAAEVEPELPPTSAENEPAIAGDTATDADTDESAVEVNSVLQDQGTTTIPEPEFILDTGLVTHTDSLYQFDRSQCVSMGSGAYHCFDAATSTSLEVAEQTLFVESDADGDKEIFLVTDNGNRYQITNNKLDDDAPYYDALSDSIVWHRLENGHYSVYAYQDKTERLLSKDFENSMEPHRAGKYTVWQSWVNDKWEIVLYDGTATRVISSHTGQSIAPQVEGEYVIWNVTNGDSHKVAVYEIATGFTSLIDDGEGARVMNPRFVLVYDTRFDNGDVITKGYDTETGSVIPLAAAAPIAPKELPESDQTGETRALLQNKSSSRDEFNDENTEPTDGEPHATSTGIATDTQDVVVATTTVGSVVLPLTDFDIIVPPFSTATSTQ